jgi:hypothetical protein
MIYRFFLVLINVVCGSCHQFCFLLHACTPTCGLATDCYFVLEVTHKSTQCTSRWAYNKFVWMPCWHYISPHTQSWTQLLKGFLLSVEARWALLWEITWWPYNIFHFKDALVTSCGWSSWVKSRAILENILCYICCHYTIFCKQPKTGGIMWSTNWLYVHQTSLLLTRNTKHVFLALFSPPWYCGAGYRVRFHRCIRYRDFF